MSGFLLWVNTNLGKAKANRQLKEKLKRKT